MHVPGQITVPALCTVHTVSWIPRSRTGGSNRDELMFLLRWALALLTHGRLMMHAILGYTGRWLAALEVSDRGVCPCREAQS